MNEEQVARALERVGVGRVHECEGVWWQQVGRGYCKPVDPLRVIVPGQARPSPLHGCIAYAHAAPSSYPLTHPWHIMCLAETELTTFSIERLKPRRRTMVRKALRTVEVRRIDDIAPVMDTMREICASQAERTGHGKPPEYYRLEARQWRAFMKREFTIPGRDWWGAFLNGELIAYYYTYLIAGTIYVAAAKSRTEALKSLPNDALLYTVLEDSRERTDCRQVVFGDWSPNAPRLNQFKEQYGFRKVSIPRFVGLTLGPRRVRLPVWGRKARTQRKIAHVTTRHGPQDDRIYHKEVLSLARRAQMVMIAPRSEDSLQWPNSVEYRPIPYRHGVVGRLRALGDAALQARASRAEVCHVHDLDFVLALPWLKLATGAKLVYDAHEAYKETVRMTPHLPPWAREPAAAVVDRLEKTAARFCDLIVTADPKTAETFEHLKVPVEVIYNYPPLDVFVPEPSKVDEIRSRFGNRQLAVYHGAMAEERGLFDMIRAMPAVLRKRDDVALLLIGLKPGPLRDATAKLVKALGIEGHVILIEWVPHHDIVNWLHACKVGLVPFHPLRKYSMNIPIKLFEYMACGLPTVVSDVDLLVDYVRRSGAGVVVEARNPEALARGLLQVLADEARWDEMSAAGKRAVHNEWNWDLMAQRLNDTYKRVLGV